MTTLTKASAEGIADLLTENGVAATYLHSGLDSAKRLDALRRLKAGELQALVGCNLLREGLDLPMVSLVAVVGAEKQGFLRSATSLIQTIGRAARHVDGRVLLYTDDGTVSDAMREAIDETNYRRAVQLDHNARHDVVPVGAGQNKSAENTEILDLLGPSKPESAGYAPDFADPVDAALYDALRDWRKLTAASLGKRPFMVLNQKTLENVVQLRPTNESALLAVHGIGPKKSARYGDAVLAIVNGTYG